MLRINSLKLMSTHIIRAYETLSDPNKKSQYDSFGKDADNIYTQQSYQNSPFEGANFDGATFESFFRGFEDELFNRRQKPNRESSKKGKDINV